MKIREATPKDVDQLLPMLVDSERFHVVNLEKERVDMKGLEKEARNDLSLWFKDQYKGYVAEDSGKIIGLVLAQTGDTVGKGWIYDIYVTPEYRQQGWAQQLLNRAVEWLKTKGVKRVRLEVHKDNESALRLYKRQGFKQQPPTYLYQEKEI